VTKAKEILKMVEDTDELAKQQVVLLKKAFADTENAFKSIMAYEKWLKDNQVGELLSSSAESLADKINVLIKDMDGVV
jgi:hypothetical protein